MKVLKNLKKKVTNLEGKVCQHADGREVLVKDIITGQMLSAEYKDILQIVRIRNLAQKIFDAKKDTIEVEDADFKAIKDSFNKPNYPVIFVAFAAGESGIVGDE